MSNLTADLVPKFTAKCTTCKKSWEMTREQEREAATIGVPFSPCCNAVATVTKVTARRAKK